MAFSTTERAVWLASGFAGLLGFFFAAGFFFGLFILASVTTDRPAVKSRGRQISNDTITDGQPPEWCLFLDNVGDRVAGGGAVGYIPFVSHDPSSGQFTPASDFKFPYRFRHGSVLPITSEELQRLKSAYPAPEPAP
jgi:hypothetical protein